MTDRIINEVSGFYGISYNEMKSATRLREIVQARHVAIYFLQKYTQQTKTAIGAIFYRDHTTVIHAYNSIENLLFSDSVFRSDIEYLDNIFKEYLNNPISQEIYMENDFFTN